MKWIDVDFDRGVLEIQQAISRQNGGVEEASVENEKCLSRLPLSADAISVLKVQKNKAGGSGC